MGKKIINLGKVKARTKELRLNDTIIEHKYDDETEWQPLVDLGEAGSSIDTVSGYSDLPTDAKENDVAIVETEEYIRTDNKTVVLPIEVKLPDEGQEIPNIYPFHFKDRFNSVLDSDELKSYNAGALSVNIESDMRSIMYVDISSKLAPMMANVEHPVLIAGVMDGEESMHFYIAGLSVRDFLQLMMELELEEEQWAVLLGSHANDSSEDEPVYGWVNLVTSTEPINDNSLDMGGMYGTLLFDVEAPMFNDMVGYASVSLLGLSGEEDDWSSSLSGNYSTYDSDYYDPEEQAIVLKFVNIALSNIAHSGMVEINNDIYNPKGLFQNNDGMWTSLEEKMNTPRFVDTYADLPKTSIENGIMAVAQESTYRSEPQITTKLDSYKKYRIVSAGEMTADTFNSIIEEVLPGYPSTGSIESGLYFMSLDGNQEVTIGLMRSPYNDTENLCGIHVSAFNYETDQEKRAVYFIELPSDFDTSEMFPPDKDSGELPEFNPELGKWYWCDIVEGDKESYSVGGVHEGFPTDLPEELLFGYCEIYWDEEIYPAVVGEVTTYDSDPNNRKEILSIDMKVFNFEDLSSSVTITYPAGFYRYNNNEWKHVEDVSGGNFDNEDVLRSITATDIGNIQENTEKRHEHNNKSYLDQIQWDAIDKLNNQVPQNTSARHSHSNKSTLDKITEATLSDIGNNTSKRHTHNNQSVLDMISSYEMQNIHSNTQARHSHSNKTTLDKITETTLSDINSNTSARHTHSNITYLNQINYDSINRLNQVVSNTNARHSHSNKSTLDKITETTLSDVSTNTSQRHTHNNLSTIDKLQIFGKVLMYDGISVTTNLERKGITTEEINSGKIVLENRVYKETDSILSDITIELSESYASDGGEYLIRFTVGSDTSIYIKKQVSWANGAPPPLYARKSNYDIILKFTRLNYSDIVFGEWFVVETVPIDSRLLPSNLNPNYAKVVDNELCFAPIVMGDYYYNRADKYLEQGYKKVVGEDPWTLSSELKANDECELMFKEYDDFIIVYWVVTPKGYRIGEYVNSSSITDWTMFFEEYQGNDIRDMLIGDLDTSNGVDFTGMFQYCPYISRIPNINTRNGIRFGGMFCCCTSLECLSEIDLRKATDAAGMFIGCESLITIEKIKCNSLKTSILYSTWLKNCISLENITIDGNIKIDTDGAWGLDLSTCPNLTIDSLMSFINAFEDNTGEETQYTVKIGATNLAKLSPEQIAVATAKNINLA